MPLSLRSNRIDRTVDTRINKPRTTIFKKDHYRNTNEYAAIFEDWFSIVHINILTGCNCTCTSNALFFNVDFLNVCKLSSRVESSRSKSNKTLFLSCTNTKKERERPVNKTTKAPVKFLKESRECSSFGNCRGFYVSFHVSFIHWLGIGRNLKSQ